jgi:Predicted exonuclease
MQVISKTLPDQLTYNFAGYSKDQLLFFDIETTGFLPDVSSIYLIGCCYYQNNSWQMIQWFADNYISETDLLHSFFAFMQKYDVLIHYNGSGFDIPYIQKKCLQLNLPYHFSEIISFDVYKKIKPFQKFLPIENLKQPTVEKLLDFVRTDTYTGGELIEVYGDYMKAKFMRTAELSKLQHFLCLHNEEDLCGLLYISRILAFTDIFEYTQNNFDFIIRDETLSIELTLSESNLFSFPIRLEKSDIMFAVTNHIATLNIPIYHTELKYFYESYHDYYYLPSEDMAIHKSVASYVDKSHRVKATAATCYGKKYSYFIPLYGKELTPYFKKSYKDKQLYLELSEEFQTNKAQQHYYIKHALQYLLQR